jgi:hypothetical protein
MATVGLLVGAAMRPELLAPGEVVGPQIQAGVSGPRAAPAYGGVSYTNYAGTLPDHVVGTDWLKPPPEAPPPVDYAPADYAYADELLEDPPQDAPAAAVLGGDAVATEPMATALAPEMAEPALATPG